MQFISLVILLVLPVPKSLCSRQPDTACLHPNHQASLLQLLPFIPLSTLQGLTLASVLCPPLGSTA